MSELAEAQRQRTSIQLILQEVDEQEKRDAAPVGWYDFFFKNRDIFVEKEQKQRRLIERVTVRKVQNTKLEEISSNIRILESEKTIWRANIESAQRTLAEEKRKLEAKETAEDARQKRARQAEREQEGRSAAAQRARQEEEKEKARKAELAKQREKQEAARRAALIREMERKRMAQEAEEAERQRRAAEVETVQNEMERRRREALYEKMSKAKEEHEVGTGNTNERAECPRKSEGEKRQRARQNVGRKAETTAQARKAPCLHGGWWPKIMGQFVCERCSSRTHRFAFRCPSCSVVACANCRNAMKN